MRALRLLSFMILSLFLGASALLYAQDERQQQDKPKQEEPKKQDEARPRQQDEMKPSKQDKQDKKTQQQDEKQMEKQGQEQQRNEGMERGRQAGNAHPGGTARHIPDDTFRAHFGRGHSFKAQTVIVAGQPQFSYGGYTFELVDAWPAGWVYSDDCYIDYIDGEYFLFDLLHPGIRIAVLVVM